MNSLWLSCQQGQSWSWSHGSLIYNYLWNQYVSDLRQVGCFFPDTPVSPTNKTDRHDVTEILLEVALNTITLTLFSAKKTDRHLVKYERTTSLYYNSDTHCLCWQWRYLWGNNSITTNFPILKAKSLKYYAYSNCSINLHCDISKYVVDKIYQVSWQTKRRIIWRITMFSMKVGKMLYTLYTCAFVFRMGCTMFRRTCLYT